MKIWSLAINDEYNSSFEPEIFFSEDEASEEAEAWVTAAWNNWFEFEIPRPELWEDARDELEKQVGFLDYISMTEHDISDHPAVKEATATLNVCFDRLQMNNLNREESPFIQDVITALEMLTK